MAENEGRPERLKLDWPGLLAWSTRYHDGTAPSEFSTLTDEDRDFLYKAFEAAMGEVEDLNKVMEEAIRQTQAPDRTNESIITALELIDRCCDDPDCARNVEKLGGIQALLDLLDTPHAGIRVRDMEILALLLANNPIIQKAAIDRGGMEKLMRLTRAAAAGTEERLKSLRALAALTRGVPEFEAAFLSGGGTSVLLACLDPKEDNKVKEKAAALVVTLAHERRLSPEDGLRIGEALPPLLADATSGGLQYRETLAACTLELAQATAPAAPAPGLLDAVRARLEVLEGGASDPDNEAEAAILRDCVAALAGR